MGWKQGPLPPNTFNWGGVVKAGDNPRTGFYFADFKGSSVEIHKGDGTTEKLEPHQVGWFNNCLTMPNV
jgi:hypothetical protein